jgi:hypothetical protein
MSSIILTIRKLPAMKSFTPASNEEIKSAENKLNLKFANEYKEYLSCFGAVRSKIIALTGIIDDKEYNVVELTNELRPYYPQIPYNFYIIEDVGMDGLVIWQDDVGVIYQSIPGSEPFRINDNLSDFLEHQIFKYKSEG